MGSEASFYWPLFISLTINFALGDYYLTIGDAAGELIAEATVAMEFKAASEDLARICNPHPTLNEAIKEASLAAYFKPIHL